MVFSLFLLVALGGSRRKEDKVLSGSAGGNTDEEVRDQAKTLRRAGDNYGQRERGCE